MSSTHFLFRAPDSREELRQLLQLRYAIYRESSLRNVTSKNDSEIDVDQYDLRSSHFGLYQLDDFGSKPVGYIRIVQDADDMVQNTADVLAIANDCPETLERVFAPRREPFPLMTYFPDAGMVKVFYAVRHARGERYIEPGRLSLDPSVRSIGIVTFMTMCTFALGVVQGVDGAILSCDSKHVPFYRRFGFERLDNTGDVFAAKIGFTISVLIGSPKHLTDRFHDAVLKKAESLKRKSAIWCEQGDRDWSPVSQTFALRNSCSGNTHDSR